MLKVLTKVVIAVVLFSAAEPGVSELRDGPFEACARIFGVQDGGLIYKNSAPVRSGSSHSSPIVGFREEPTLLMLRSNLAEKKTTTIYASDGQVLGRCPWATANDASGGRYRCTLKTRTVRRKAVKLTESPTIYIKARAKTCVEVPDAGKCYGSVKGLCNKTLK